LTIVALALASPSTAPTGFASRRSNVSFASEALSPKTVTATVLAVSPGPKLRDVEETAW
jgi:hypothetical protein